MYADRLIAASVSIAIASSLHAQTHVFVDDDAPDGGDGLSWNSAFNDLHDAIDLADKLGTSRGVIKIAGGVYKPDRGTGDAGVAFSITMAAGLDTPYFLMGGYAGLKNTANPDTRNTEAYPTVLDADLLGNDTNDPNSWLDNAETLLNMDIGPSATRPSISGIVLDGIGFQAASIGAVRGVLSVSAVTLSFNGCKFADNHGASGAAIRVLSGSIDIKGCSILRNTSTKTKGDTAGGAVMLTDSTVSISDSTFANNKSQDSEKMLHAAHGGALALDTCSVSIDNTSFQANFSDGDGGAIYARETNFAINDTSFTLNVAGYSRNGGAINSYSEISTTTESINGCNFEFNGAQWGGGVFSINNIQIEDSTFFVNSAVVGGGFVGRGSLINSDFINCTGSAALIVAGTLVDGCFFQGNSDSTGGAIDIGSAAVDPLPVYITNSIFENNQASHTGGAIRDPDTGDDVEVFVTGCEFVQNQSDNIAGAVYGTNVIDDCYFGSNRTDQDGGAVHSALRVSNSAFEGNRAGRGVGGGVYGTPIITASTFESNYARFGGGGAYNTNMIDTCYFRNNTSVAAGGGLYLVGEYDAYIYDSVFIDNQLLQLVVGSEVYKAGGGELTILRSTLARSEDVGSANMLAVEGGDTWIESTTIWNEAWNGQGMVRFYQENQDDIAVFIHSNLRMDQAALVADDHDDIFFLGGNITADPRFIDAAAGNVRFKPGSPCIDAGFSFGAQIETVSDVYGEPREPFDDLGMVNIGQGAGNYLDIGATEFRGTSCFADVNGDGGLTPADFTAWIALYGQGDFAADQNRDGVLTPSDFSAWISNFTNGC